MIHVALRTEYSFDTFAHIKDIVGLGGSAIGIADQNSTFGHFQHYKLCKEKGINPILGVRLMVSKPKEWAETEGKRVKMWGPNYIFIAKNRTGLIEMYGLVKKAYDNFYYHPFIEITDIANLSSNLIVIAEDYDFIDRIDYIGISPVTNPKILSKECNLPRVALSSNRYIESSDRKTYQLLSGSDRNAQTYPQFILSEDQHLSIYGDQDAIDNTNEIAEQCNVEFVKSDMVKYKGFANIDRLCKNGAKRKGIDLDDPVYKARFEREMELIKSRNFDDYFLIVADMIQFAKKTMFVGPSRGSSAGSLVCYLLDITEVEPVKYGLIFERFIDINRADLPDIDIDFPDISRNKVVKYLANKYGQDHVAHIATISRLKPRSAIGIFGKNLSIPFADCEDVKNAVIERSGADARAAMCITDTFTSTEIGKDFVERYPSMQLVERIENHASHTGTHAAGIIVCNDPLTDYGGVNSRENVVMLDKHEAEGLNLLKIDVLGLRTLSILQEVAERIGMDYNDYYTLRTDDPVVYKTFSDMKLFGIFQFEGYALQAITREMGCEDFNDICAITSLARPGPLQSGGSDMYVKRKIGAQEVTYLSKHPAIIDATKDTYGIIVYQEQLMTIAREYGNMSWEEVGQLRKAASKSLGEEFFNKHKEKFLAGTRENGIDDAEADSVWKHMVTFGSWAFNKSHAVSYALISYWTAWAKTYHPLEFCAANMNNARTENSAIRILRELVKNEGVEYTAIDPDDSTARWEISDGKLIGSLTNIRGIGPKKAADIIKRRKNGNLTPNMLHKLLNPDTAFNILFPARHHWGDLYDDPMKWGLSGRVQEIAEVSGEGEYMFIGKLVDKDLRDLNEYHLVVKRGGDTVDTDSLYLNMTMEDDTDSISCVVSRFDYERMGRNIAEHGRVDHDWYLILGTINSQWRRVKIKNIINLWEWSK